MDPVLIEYNGAAVRVTPDTARDLVDRGMARVIGGQLPPAEAVEVDVSEENPAPAPARKPRAKAGKGQKR